MKDKELIEYLCDENEAFAKDIEEGHDLISSHDGHYVAWDEIIEACGNGMEGYSQSPLELISRIRNERYEMAACIATHQDIERNYTHQLGEMARLSDIVCTYIYGAGTEGDAEVMEAVVEIMQYVDAVRPGDAATETKWAMHIIGPDDIIPCVGEFDALRKANQHNKQFAKLMKNDPSPNDPYCVALAESV